MTYKSGFWITLLILIVFCIFWWKSKPIATSIPGTVNEAVELKKSLLRTVIVSGLDNKGKAIVVNSSTGKKIKPCKDKPIIISDVEIYPVVKQDKTKNTISQKSDCLVQIVNPNQDLRTVLKVSESILEGNIKKDGKVVPAKFYTQITAFYDGSICRTHHVGGNQHTICIQQTDLCKDMLEDAIYYNDQELIDEVKADCGV